MSDFDVRKLPRWHEPSDPFSCDSLLGDSTTGAVTALEGAPSVKGLAETFSRDSLNSHPRAVKGQPNRKGWSSRDTIASAPLEDPRIAMQQLIEASRNLQEVSSASEPEPVINAAEASASYLGSAYVQLSDWAAWMWNAINPFASNEQARSDQIDEAKNVFTEEVNRLSPSERKQFRQFIHDMNQLFDKLKELFDDDKMEQAMLMVLKEAIRSKGESDALIREVLRKNYAEKQVDSKKRLQEAEQLVEKVKRNKYWGRLEEWASTLGLTASATALLGSSSWGVVALCYAVGTIWNRWKGPYIEAQLAKGLGQSVSWLTNWNAKKTEKNCFEVLRLGSGILNIILALSAGQFTAISSILQGTTQLVSAQVEHQMNQTEGRLAWLDFQLENHQEKIQVGIRNWGKLHREIERVWQLMQRAAYVAQSVKKEIIHEIK